MRLKGKVGIVVGETAAMIAAEGGQSQCFAGDWTRAPFITGVALPVDGGQSARIG
jgi:hypothetical protein